jgi:hypothetical protein
MNYPTFDLVGVGLNATDTLIKVAHFPAYGGKVPIEAEILRPSAQVASALTRRRCVGAVMVVSAQRRPGTDTSG